MIGRSIGLALSLLVVIIKSDNQLLKGVLEVIRLDELLKDEFRAFRE